MLQVKRKKVRKKKEVSEHRKYWICLFAYFNNIISILFQLMKVIILKLNLIDLIQEEKDKIKVGFFQIIQKSMNDEYFCFLILYIFLFIWTLLCRNFFFYFFSTLWRNQNSNSYFTRRFMCSNNSKIFILFNLFQTNYFCIWLAFWTIFVIPYF